MHRWIASVAAAGCLLAISLGTTSAASADQIDDALWYYNDFHVQAAHDAGWTGAGVTIAVIDSQLNPDLPELAGADVEPQRPPGCTDAEDKTIPTTTASLAAFHGTNVAALIVGSGVGYAGARGVKGVAPKVKVLYYTSGKGSSAASNNGASQCYSYVRYPLATEIDDAVAGGAEIISISQGGRDGPELASAVARGSRWRCDRRVAVERHGNK